MLKVLFTVLTICAAGGLSGATFTVLNVGDAGADTLRDAINQHNTAGGTNTIEFDTGLSGTINLASQLPVIDTGDLTIVGLGADVLTVSGGGSVPCLGLGANNVTVSVTISGLTIADGSQSVGAGISITIIDGTANLTLTDCIFSGHQASTSGGAIYSFLLSIGGSPAFNLSVTGCTFSGNNSSSSAGAVALQDVQGVATADFTNCTFSGNTANGGAAIWADASSVTLTNCTITDNQAANGGGILIAGGTLELRNTIVAGNTATASGPDIAGTATSLDGNLIGDDSGLTMTALAADQVGTAAAPIAPMLRALADYGGRTPTHALLSGSPAINAGVTTGAPADDQRGVTRDANPDIGAYEFVPGATFTVLNVGDAGSGTLRDAINQHNTAGGTNTIEFDTGLSGTINLATQLPVINTGDLTIVGPGADVLTISGGGSVPCLGLNALSGSATVSVTISGLTIADGSTTGVGAGINIVIIRSTANLTLTDCVFSGHQASFGGGAIYLSLVSGTPAFNLSVSGCTFSGNSSPLLEGAVILRDGDGITTADFTNCTFSGNTATDDGAAIWTDASSVTLTNCTITGNQAANGGGILIAGGTLELRNTIVAGNTATASGPDIAGTATSLDGNLIGDVSGLTMAPQAADQGGTAAAPIDAMLGALADNGGTTPTHALLSGSPAINAGVTTGAPADDQRGITRDANPDIGAYEFVPPEIEVSHGAATVTNGGTVALMPDTPAEAARVETVTVSNVAIADADLDLSGGVSLSGQTNCTATVTSAPAATVIAGGNTTFGVEITPTAAGAYSVTVTIPNSDPVNNPFVFTFTGNAASAPGEDGGGDDGDESCSTGEGRGYAWLALLGVPAALAIRGYRGKRSR